MRRRGGQALIGGLAVLLLLALAGGVALAAEWPGLSYRWSMQRWEQRGPSHYTVDLSWASDQNFGHVRAEMRDGVVVRAIDLDTGQPAAPSKWAAASFYGSMDRLFRMIQDQLRPEPSLRGQLARYHPLLARWLDPCAALLPRISYDRDLGYPTSIHYRGTPCFNGGNVYLTVSNLQPLP